MCVKFSNFLFMCQILDIPVRIAYGEFTTRVRLKPGTSIDREYLVNRKWLEVLSRILIYQGIQDFH